MAKPASVAIVKPGCSQLEQKKFDDIFYFFRSAQREFSPGLPVINKKNLI